MPLWKRVALASAAALIRFPGFFVIWRTVVGTTTASKHVKVSNGTIIRLRLPTQDAAGILRWRRPRTRRANQTASFCKKDRGEIGWGLLWD